MEEEEQKIDLIVPVAPVEGEEPAQSQEQHKKKKKRNADFSKHNKEQHGTLSFTFSCIVFFSQIGLNRISSSIKRHRYTSRV